MFQPKRLSCFRIGDPNQDKVQNSTLSSRRFWNDLRSVDAKHRIFLNISFMGSLGILVKLFIPILGDLSHTSLPRIA